MVNYVYARITFDKLINIPANRFLYIILFITCYSISSNRLNMLPLTSTCSRNIARGLTQTP